MRAVRGWHARDFRGPRSYEGGPRCNDQGRPPYRSCRASSAPAPAPAAGGGRDHRRPRAPVLPTESERTDGLAQ
ncbi:hypothetical protein MICRO116_440009 [Micrococcus sp. 116]|nr:hypothetical protein MICRO116_440009 [Micrococcus sp. 116]